MITRNHAEALFYRDFGSNFHPMFRVLFPWTHRGTKYPNKIIDQIPYTVRARLLNKETGEVVCQYILKKNKENPNGYWVREEGVMQ